MTNRHIVHTKINPTMANTSGKDSKQQTEKGAQKKMDQLVYTPSHDGEPSSAAHQPTMVLMVDTAEFKKWKTDKSIPLANVVESFQVHKYESGRSGILSKPSKAELEAAFQTTNVDKIIQFMMENGALRNKVL